MKRKLSATVLLIVLILSLLVGCSSTEANISLDDIPEFSGKAYVAVNNNVPFFTEEDITSEAFEEYSKLDPLGRCGAAFACIGIEIMPTEDREEIGSVTPSGWKYNKVSNNNQYDFVDGGYIYNRCHLIGFQLAGENANEKNLITGTRYLNIEGMLPFENQVAAYVKATEKHVLLRVTPIYESENLVASGVLMEGYSVEDKGAGIEFCVYAYNVQPGVVINYFTGQNAASGEQLPPIENEPENPLPDYYVINIKSKKIHGPTCSLAEKISEENRQEFSGDYETLCEEYKGYTGCGSCLPDLIIENLPEDSPEDENKDTVEEDTVEGKISYVLNIKNTSKKYHLPTCKNLPSEDNRVDFTGDLESLKDQYPDFTQCGICKPDEEKKETQK